MQKDEIYKTCQTKNIEIALCLEKVQAGFPSPASDFIDKKLDLNSLVIKNEAATFFVKVDGTSMEDANIFKDDILVVDRSINPCNGKIIIAILNGEFLVKRLKIIKNKFYLFAENPKFNPIEISKDEDFEIWGVVTYIIHKAK